MMTKLTDFSARSLAGVPIDFHDYRNQVVLVVNTASKCGFTPQYDGLQKLYEQYQDRGFVVLGFPSNDFAQQEPGSSNEIGEFCRANYGVTFPMFEKVHVTGTEIDPLFDWLTAEQTGILGKRVKWNFSKFLINRNGEVVDRFAPQTEPADLTDAIESALEA
ncbi:MAG: glutathione peroxidase [Canibacter sp.]